MAGQVSRQSRHGLLIGALLLSACAKQVVGTTATLPGGAPVPVPTVAGSAPNAIGNASGKGVVDDFLTAVNKQDLQAMSGLWGTSKGLARDQLKREELEKRLIVMQCLLQSDKYKFIEDTPRLSTGGRLDFVVELTKGTNKAPARFTTVQSVGGRWVVEDVDLSKLREFCR